MESYWVGWTPTLRAEVYFQTQDGTFESDGDNFDDSYKGLTPFGSSTKFIEFGRNFNGKLGLIGLQNNEESEADMENIANGNIEISKT